MTVQKIIDHPILKQSWDSRLNDPADINLSAMSHKKLWWNCDLGHSYQMAAANRIKSDNNCPYCCRRQVLAGFNDLSATHPELVSQWNYSKNALLPTELLYGSHKKVWWKDQFGHEWEAKINSRTSQNLGCPICANKQVLEGYNDLASSGLPYANEWHPTKNVLLASEVTISSGKKVWWQDSFGHEWEAKVNDRRNGQGCPVCGGIIFTEGVDGLDVTHPKLAEEWHPTKNGTLSPKIVRASSLTKVWWMGTCGHEWQTPITYRAKGGADCPYCGNRIVLLGFNDLATTNPELAVQWHPTKNVIPISEVTISSGHRAWWQDQFGHEWESIIHARKGKQSCPYCTNRIALPGFNDLGTIDPELAAQWHPTKNKDLVPQLTTAGSSQRVWWICAKGHEWDTKIVDRHTYKSGCPTCSAGLRTSKGEKEIFEYLKKHLPAISNDRSLLKSKELDIYIPSKNIAVEFNGLYWHDETRKSKNYHYDKWLECKQQGVQLIQIWEDDWKNNPELILNMLAYKLNLKVSKRIYARTTKIIQVPKKEAERFLEKNHIQGFASGSYYLGLVDSKTNDLISVLVLRKEKGETLNIIRFASSCNVIGGFTKLLKYAKTHYVAQKIITFSDNSVSNGNLYSSTGFKAVKLLPPDYMYIIRGQRKHKFGYRISKFKTDPELTYIEGYSEKQLADLNNLTRIWDAGKIKWELKLPTNPEL